MTTQPTNSSQTRSEKAAVLKSIIQDLHDGLSPEMAKARFDEAVKDVSPQEIGAMEEELIREGLPVGEIQRLCDLHVSVVQESLERQDLPVPEAGHPVHTYLEENEVITQEAGRLGELCSAVGEGDLPDEAWSLAAGQILKSLAGVHNHYLRKENELFPVLERHGIKGPSQVMWGVHDEIRSQLKATRAALEAPSPEAPKLGAGLARSVIEMVYKEKKILLPLALETLSRQEWAEVRRGEDELGYAFFSPPVPFSVGQASAPADPEDSSGPRVVPAARRPGSDLGSGPAAPRQGSGPGLVLPIISPEPVAPLPENAEGYLDLGTGRLSLEQVDMMLRHLPVDLSFVDADGFVRYYSETEERLFPRTPGAIGRHVTNCHPPKSVHMVEEILRVFAAGERDVSEFWIEMAGKFIHIRYFAVRNPAGEYLGCLEVSQDVTGIRTLEGERRLLEWS